MQANLLCREWQSQWEAPSGLWEPSMCCFSSCQHFQEFSEEQISKSQLQNLLARHNTNGAQTKTCGHKGRGHHKTTQTSMKAPQVLPHHKHLRIYLYWHKHNSALMETSCARLKLEMGLWWNRTSTYKMTNSKTPDPISHQRSDMEPSGVFLMCFHSIVTNRLYKWM